MGIESKPLLNEDQLAESNNNHILEEVPPTQPQISNMYNVHQQPQIDPNQVPQYYDPSQPQVLYYTQSNPSYGGAAVSSVPILHHQYSNAAPPYNIAIQPSSMSYPQVQIIQECPVECQYEDDHHTVPMIIIFVVGFFLPLVWLFSCCFLKSKNRSSNILARAGIVLFAIYFIAILIFFIITATVISFDVEEM